MKALQVSRNVARLGLARMASAISPSAAAKVGPLKMVSVDPPDPLGPGWQTVRTRLSGICGSDLSTIEGHASTYFDDLVSFPFTPGHEVVGELDLKFYGGSAGHKMSFYCHPGSNPQNNLYLRFAGHDSLRVDVEGTLPEGISPESMIQLDTQ